MINIISGWFNLLFNLRNDLARYRAKKCLKCPHFVRGWHEAIIGDEIKEIKGYMCDICHCPSSALLRSKHAECALKKW